MPDTIHDCPSCGSLAYETDEYGGPNANKLDYYITCSGEECCMRTTSDYGKLQQSTTNSWNRRYFQDLLEYQVRLDPETEAIIFDNLEELYEE